MSRTWAIFLAAVCFAGGFWAAFYVRPALAAICLVYVIMNVAYSYKLKHFAIIDVLIIAFGFVLRAVAGAVAVHVPASGWFLLCTILGALFLGLEKRRYELMLLATQTTEHRQSLSGYSVALVQRLESLIAPSLLTAYTFYSFLSFHGQWMLVTVPIVLYGMMRYQYLSEFNAATGTPEDLFWKDRPIQCTLVLWTIACAAVIYGHPSQWLHELARDVDSIRIGN